MVGIHQKWQSLVFLAFNFLELLKIFRATDKNGSPLPDLTGSKRFEIKVNSNRTFYPCVNYSFRNFRNYWPEIISEIDHLSA